MKKKSEETETKESKTKKTKKIDVTDKKTNKTAKDKTQPHNEKEQPEVKINFKIGETVVYPFHGIGKIIRKEKNTVNGKEVQFCVINIPSSQMNISLPTSIMKEKGIRFLMGKEELKTAISNITKITENFNMDWKMRQQTNNILIKKGDIESSIKVVASLYKRNKEKELPLQEKRIYETTLSMISEEMSLVLGVTKKDALEEIKKKLEKI